MIRQIRSFRAEGRAGVRSVPRVDPDTDTRAKRIVAKVAFTPVGRWLLRNVLPHVDPLLVRLSHGWISTVAVTPVVLLTHTGARSGTRRTTPLIYFTDRDRVILIASNYGSSRNPAWYHNVKANPEVTLRIRGFEAPFVGAEVTGAERDRLWALATGWLAGYEEYQRLAGRRQIPMLAFAPAKQQALVLRPIGARPRNQRQSMMSGDSS
jgi:deazaflavin-dependent oxidoreductase (nitroreductase family)